MRPWRPVALTAVSLAALSLAPPATATASEVTVRGTIVDQYGAPAARVQVQLAGTAQSYEASTDASGRYAALVQPGDYYVSGGGAGYPDLAHFATETVSTGSDPAVETTDDATIQRSNWLELVVRDQFGRPAADVGAGWGFARGDQPIAAGIGGDPAAGILDFYDLPTGPLDVYVGGPTGSFVGQHWTFTLGAGVTQATVDVQRRVPVRGRVVDDQGLAVAGVVVSADHCASVGHTSVSGSYRLLCEAASPLTFVDPSGAHLQTTRAVGALGASGLALTDTVMPRGAAAQVTATDLRGRAIPRGVLMTLYRRQPSGRYQFVENPLGSDTGHTSTPTVRGLAAGRYKATVYEHVNGIDKFVYDYQPSAAHAGDSVVFDLVPGETVQLTARLQRTVHTALDVDVARRTVAPSARQRLTVRVTAGGRPVPTGPVQVTVTTHTRAIGYDRVLSRRSDGRLTLLLPRLPRGKVTVLAAFTGTAKYRYSEATTSFLVG
jgi:hypothetical protein